MKRNHFYWEFKLYLFLIYLCYYSMYDKQFLTKRSDLKESDLRRHWSKQISDQFYFKRVGPRDRLKTKIKNNPEFVFNQATDFKY